MKYILGVVDSKIYNLETGRYEYSIRFEISEDVLKWLEIHDVEYTEEEYTEDRNKVFICNAIKYELLGPKIELTNG